MKKEVVERYRPQDDIPQEVIERYMIKDYQRMFNKYESLHPVWYRQKLKIIELSYAVKKAAAETISNEEAKESLMKALKRAEKEETSLQVAREKNKELNELCNRLSFQIEDMKKSREAVIEAVTSDLKEQLEAANDKIMLLAQAVTGSDIKKQNVLRAVNIAGSEDDRKWMDGAMKQLEKAAMKLLTTEERLVKYEESLKESGNEYTEKIMKPLGKAISSINSTLSHIECFFDKVGEIKIVENV